MDTRGCDNRSICRVSQRISQSRDLRCDLKRQGENLEDRARLDLLQEIPCRRI